MRVHDVMSAPVILVAPDTTVGSARDILAVNRIKHLAVVEKNRIVGVACERRLASAPGDTAVATIMRRAVTIRSDATLRSAAGKLTENDARCLIVLHENELAGIITATDLLRALAKGNTHPAPQTDRVVLRSRGENKKHRHMKV